MITTNHNVVSEGQSGSSPAAVDQYAAIDHSAITDTMQHERHMIVDRGSSPESELVEGPESQVEPTRGIYDRGNYADATQPASLAGHPLPLPQISSLDPSVSNRSSTAVPGNEFRGSLDGQPVVLRVDKDGLEILPDGDTSEGSPLMIRFELLDEFRPTPVRCTHPMYKLLLSLRLIVTKRRLLTLLGYA